MLEGTYIESMLTALSMYPHIVFVMVLMNSPGPTSEGCEVCSKDDDDNDNDKTVAGPKVLAHVDLAKTVYELVASEIFLNHDP